MKIGIIGRHHDILDQKDWDIIETARIEALKISDLDDRHYDPLMTIFCAPTGGWGMPEEYVALTSDLVREAWDKGVQHFIIHDAPNTSAFGYGVGWTTGLEFAQWWEEVRERFREILPGAYWGMPACEPGPGFGRKKGDSEEFLETCMEALPQPVDFYTLKWHWKDRDEMRVGLWRIDSFTRRWPTTPILIEFCNPNSTVSKEDKGNEYLEFYRELRSREGILAACAFCVSSADIAHKYVTWRGENSSVPRNVIHKIIGERDF